MHGTNLSDSSSSTSRIEKKLNKFITEVRAGYREGSVVTTAEDVIENIESPDVWAQLRRELEDVGISPAVMEENHDYVAGWMKTALAQGLVEEDAPAESQFLAWDGSGYPQIQSSPSPSATSLDSQLTPTLTSPPLPLDAPVQRSPTQSQVSFRTASSMTLANDEFETKLRRRQTERPIDELFKPLTIQSIPPVKKKSRADPKRLMKKLFQKDTDIIQAASDGDIEKVAKLIGLGCNVNARDRWGYVCPSFHPSNIFSLLYFFS
jgi:hypothetical protein